MKTYSLVAITTILLTITSVVFAAPQQKSTTGYGITQGSVLPCPTGATPDICIGMGAVPPSPKPEYYYVVPSQESATDYEPVIWVPLLPQ